MGEARKEYEMSPEQFETLVKSMQPTPVMMIGGVKPASTQERANGAWAALGKEMGFHHMTAQPVEGKGPRFFTAEPQDVH